MNTQTNTESEVLARHAAYLRATDKMTATAVSIMWTGVAVLVTASAAVAVRDFIGGKDGTQASTSTVL